jgi:hypothetical protein
MNRARFVSAIGSVDAHSWFAWGPFRKIIFHERGELRGIRTHLYVDEADWGDEAKMEGAVLSAMRDGRGFMSNFRRGDARGGRIYLRYADGAERYPGRASDDRLLADSKLLAGGSPSAITMNVELPEKARIELLRNGEVIQSASGKSAAWPVSAPGVYRVEARRGGNAWIYSNPFPVGRYPL